MPSSLTTAPRTDVDEDRTGSTTSLSAPARLSGTTAPPGRPPRRAPGAVPEGIALGVVAGSLSFGVAQGLPCVIVVGNDRPARRPDHRGLPGPRAGPGPGAGRRGWQLVVDARGAAALDEAAAELRAPAAASVVAVAGDVADAGPPPARSSPRPTTSAARRLVNNASLLGPQPAAGAGRLPARRPRARSTRSTSSPRWRLIQAALPLPAAPAAGSSTSPPTPRSRPTRAGAATARPRPPSSSSTAVLAAEHPDAAGVRGRPRRHAHPDAPGGLPRRGHLRPARCPRRACPACAACSRATCPSGRYRAAGAAGERCRRDRDAALGPPIAALRPARRARGHRAARGPRPRRATACGCSSPAGTTGEVAHATLRRPARLPRRRATSWWSTRRPRSPAAVDAEPAGRRASASSTSRPELARPASGSSSCAATGRRRQRRSADAPAGRRSPSPGGGTGRAARRRYPAAGGRLWVAALDLPARVARLAGRHGRPIRYGYVDRPLAAVAPTRPCSPPSRAAPRCRAPAGPSPPRLVTRLVAGGVGVAPLVLHTGVSSLEADEPPYPERYRVPAATARARQRRPRQAAGSIAVGTTVVRALETVGRRARRRRTRARAGPSWWSRPSGACGPSTACSPAGTSPRRRTSLMLEAVAGRAAARALLRRRPRRGLPLARVRRLPPRSCRERALRANRRAQRPCRSASDGR